MMEHRFGGSQTVIKLDALQKYLHFYTTALKKQNFRLLYIDAFAGSGECIVKIDNKDIVLDGSAKIAIQNTPEFDELHFIEEHKGRVRVLQNLQNANKLQTIKIYKDDANNVVKSICSSTDWNNTRAVIFLDPYGMSVAWETLVDISRTKAVDLWYLFPLSGIYRQAAKDIHLVDEHKANSLDVTLGTSEWRDAFYSESNQTDMFSSDPKFFRTANVEQIEKFVLNRLKSIFPAVITPLRLPKVGAPLYSLFFAASNPSAKAISLSTNVANEILKSY